MKSITQLHATRNYCTNFQSFSFPKE